MYMIVCSISIRIWLISQLNMLPFIKYVLFEGVEVWGNNGITENL